MRVVHDEAGAGQEGERLFTPYRHAVERQWDIELAAHPKEPMLDLIFKIDTRTHTVDVSYRLQLDGFRPAISAGQYLGQKTNRDACWIWMIVPNNDRLLFALSRPRSN